MCVVLDLMSGSKPCHAFTSSLQWKLSDNICKIFVKSFNFRLISAKIPQLQKSEIDDRENENESRLFCQVRLPGGKSFDMVGVDWGKFMMLFILFYSPFVFDNIRLWRYSESRIAQLNSEFWFVFFLRGTILNWLRLRERFSIPNQSKTHSV